MNSEAYWENMLVRVISIKKTHELRPEMHRSQHEKSVRNSISGRGKAQVRFLR